MTNKIVRIALAVLVVILAWLVVQSIRKPVKFNQKVTERTEQVVSALKDIRAAQISFKNIHGRYTKSFDTLISFVRTGMIPVVKMVPDPTDTTFTRTIKDTIGYVKVADSLFKQRKGFSVENLKFIPFSSNQLFELNSGIIEKGGVNVNVFEASAHYEKFLKGLDNQLVINLIAAREQLEKYPGLKVGSMTEASIDGNWE